MKNTRLTLSFALCSALTIIANVPMTKAESTEQSSNFWLPARQSTDIEEMVATALAKRPSLEALHYATLAIKTEQKKTLAGYLPQLSLSVTPNISNSKKGITHAIGFQGSQLLYSFSGPQELYRIVRKDAQAARLAEELHKTVIRNQVETAYLQSWLLQKQQFQVTTLETSSKATFESDTHKNDLGLLNKTEQLTSAATYAKNIVTASTYQENVSIAQRTLENSLGCPLGRSLNPHDKDQYLKLKWKPTTSVELEPLSHYYAQALSHRIEPQIKQLEIEKEELNEKFSVRQNLPSASLIGNVATERLTGSPFAATRFIGLQVGWNYFDGFANNFESRAARARATKALLEKKDIELAIKLQVETSYYQAQSLIKQLTAQHVDLMRVSNDYELSKQQLSLGLISPVDFETAKAAWESGRFNWLTLRNSLAIKLRELAFNCGYPPHTTTLI